MNFLTKKYKSIIFRLKKKTDLDNLKIKKKNLNSLFNYFGTDKGNKLSNPYSKLKEKKLFRGHGFAKYYEKNFYKLKKKKLNILEIGVWKGASTASFYHYFKQSKLFAIDRNFKFEYLSKRIHFVFCDTTSKKDLNSLKNLMKSKKVLSFDIIIDDGSHILSDILKNLIFFFKLLKPNGIYVIEDYKHPNYYPQLNDLKNHFFIDKVLFFLKNKKVFKSHILKKENISYLNKNIKNIITHEGICIEKGKNISNIAFIYKKK
jgi:SAM-dependent methyltransferase